MAGNSQRKGAIRKGGKGASVGSGGNVRRALEGKGPTPKAGERPNHKAYKSAKKAERTNQSRPQRRRTVGEAEWIVGRNSVVEALRAHIPITGIYVAEGAERDARLREAFKLAAEQGLNLLETTRNEMDRMTGLTIHQGLSARLPAFEYAHADDFVEDAKKSGDVPLIIALDSITDPRNLGAIIRSAAGFGAHGVVIPERRAAGMTATAWKTSAGAAARLPIAQTVNMTRQLKAYQDMGCMVVGLAADGDITLPELVEQDGLASGPLVVVIGAEGKGLSRLVAETCDQLVSIPIASSLESLNASVAAAVALYAIAQSRA